jgi:hypothetical protein
MIKKVRFRDGGYAEGTRPTRLITIYIVIWEGRRVDSFLKFRNAHRRLKALRHVSSSS